MYKKTIAGRCYWYERVDGKEKYVKPFSKQRRKHKLRYVPPSVKDKVRNAWYYHEKIPSILKWLEPYADGSLSESTLRKYVKEQGFERQTSEARKRYHAAMGWEI